MDLDRDAGQILASAVQAAARAEDERAGIEAFNAELRRRWPRYRVSAMLAPSIIPVRREQLAARMRCLLGAVALAAEEFRMEKGRWPENLQEIVPKYLKTVPEDAFGTGPVRYRRDETGARLYSLGRDGIDNGGRTREEVEKMHDAGNAPEHWTEGLDSGDLVFRLLDPARRGASRSTFREDVMNSDADFSDLERAGYNEEKLRRLGFSDEDMKELKDEWWPGGGAYQYEPPGE
jgi:hypothetical protein